VPRGGRRPGAGRKSALDWLETLVVGAECQTRWRSIIDSRLNADIAAHFFRSDYHDAVARVRASRGKDQEALEDVEYSRREMSGMAPEDPSNAPRLVNFRASRPYGARAIIIREVAAWASNRFGRRITTRSVERAWKLVRWVERSDN
jgi:hypothetical protein